MKKIAGYLRLYLKEEFHPLAFLISAAFLGICIWLNYHFHIDRRYIEGMGRSPLKIPVSASFYLLPWLCILLIQSFFSKKFSLLKQPGLWVAILFGVCTLALSDWVWFHRGLSQRFFDGHADYFMRKTSWNIKNSLMYGLPLLLFWRIRDRELGSFYGLQKAGFDWRPYLFMLALMLPGVVWASFQTDFLETYPTYRPIPGVRLWGLPQWMEMGLYEMFYGLDFTFVELFFRGFLVIGLAKYLGKSAILPMVGMYCFLHFGKPVGETISSCFGGLLLGVIAYETRSVLGGVAIHMGVAWMMDAAAYLQSYVFNKI